MSKLDECLEVYNEQFKKIGVKKVDQDLLRKAAKACGPAIYKADASKVAASDQKELETIKTRFLEKKLGVTGEKADKAIAAVIEKFGKSNRNKYRAMFYYLLAKETRKSKEL